MTEEKERQFKQEIASAINRVSKENDSNTPDFVLADYVDDCLTAFAKASRAREKWYGRSLSIGNN